MYLISETFTANVYGVYEKTEVRRKVFCDVSSVTQTEWFEGGRNGLNPEYRLTMFVGDYEGEQVCELNGVRYTIYRTYITKNDLIELYVEKRKGNENG